jgi:hypothetical protein
VSQLKCQSATPDFPVSFEGSEGYKNKMLNNEIESLLVRLAVKTRAPVDLSAVRCWFELEIAATLSADCHILNRFNGYWR